MIIHRIALEIADIDRGIYADHQLTLAQHPLESDERMLVRVLAFALNVNADDDHGPLEFARDVWHPDEPSLWQRDYTGDIVHWIEVGQPDEKRLQRMTARVGRVSVYAFEENAPEWWQRLEPRLGRVRNLSVWQIPTEQSQALAVLAQRAMNIQVTVQEGAIWMGDGSHSLEVAPIPLFRQAVGQ